MFKLRRLNSYERYEMRVNRMLLEQSLGLWCLLSPPWWVMNFKLKYGVRDERQGSGTRRMSVALHPLVSPLIYERKSRTKIQDSRGSNREPSERGSDSRR